MTRAKLGLVALGLAGLLAWPAGAVAKTEALTCGEQIDHDVTVTNDLTCPPGAPPISVARSGVTVDLGGHELDRAFGTVMTAEGVDRVTIRNGSLFTQGLALRVSGHHDRLADLTGFGDTGGLLLHDGGWNRLRDVGLGSRCISTAQSQQLADERWDVIVGTPEMCGGLQITGSRHVVVRDSRYEGISLDPASAFNWIAGNDMSHAEQPAFHMLDVAGDHNVIEGNTVFDGSISGDDNLVARNVVERGPSFHSGLTVSGAANVLWRNESDDSRADGFDITAPGNLLAGNRAFGNAQLGIDAVAGTLDLGGNRASGNGDPRQCVGVRCAP